MPVSESYLAFLDTETTGLDPEDEIIELAVILTDMQLAERDRYHAKLKPTRPVNPRAAEVNGYDPSVWVREALPFADFIAWTRARIPFGHVAVPVGHNVAFDQPKIERGFKAVNAFCPLSRRGVCTVSVALAMRLAGAIKCDNVKLSTVAAALQLPPPTHRAMADAACAIRKPLILRSSKPREE